MAPSSIFIWSFLMLFATFKMTFLLQIKWQWIWSIFRISGNLILVPVANFAQSVMWSQLDISCKMTPSMIVQNKFHVNCLQHVKPTYSRMNTHILKVVAGCGDLTFLCNLTHWYRWIMSWVSGQLFVELLKLCISERLSDRLRTRQWPAWI